MGTSRRTRHPLAIGAAVLAVLTLVSGVALGAARPSIGVRADRALTPVSVGQSAVVGLTVTTSGVASPVHLAVTGVPSTLRATITPSRLDPEPARSGAAGRTTTRATLRVTALEATPPGTRTLTVTATAAAGPGQVARATATVRVAVVRSFTLSGTVVQPLTPGTSVPLDLRLTNPGPRPVIVTGLTVAVRSVDRTAAAVAAGLPCTPADYAVTAYTGGRLTLGAGRTTSLTGAGVRPAHLPRVTMLDTASDQDGCRGARLTLSLTGTGRVR